MAVHRFAPPCGRYLLLQLEDGSLLAAGDDGGLRASPRGGDEACWSLAREEAGAAEPEVVCQRHTKRSARLRVHRKSDGDGPFANPVWDLCVEPGQLELLGAQEGTAGPDGHLLRVTVLEGPASLPSEYLELLDEAGWVCCPCLLGDRLLGSLRHDIASMRAEESLRASPDGCPAVVESADRVGLVNCISYSANFARMALHPVLLFLVESYLDTGAFRLAHSPAVGITKPRGLKLSADRANLIETPKGAGGGWHVDYPLHDMKAPYPEGVVLGLQANFCIDDFDVQNSTNFKLGTHRSRQAPPPSWNAPGDDPHFPPFAPRLVDSFDCPGGTLILYNANTWHRGGLNVSDQAERACCLHAFTPEWVVPKSDQMGSFQAWTRSGQFARLNEREQTDARQLWVGQLSETRGCLGNLRMAPEPLLPRL